ncbi:MAG: shikimate dehydrogenase [Rubrivivax sp.]|nr:shikimate dehydrogenase [Rubrivivax sp.]MDP3610969.1 shikimate dehydrogenase [Rubrivivax sp.]
MAATKLLVGLIGSGIQLSLTPAMQEEEARHQGLRLHYQLIDLDQTPGSVQQLPALLASARIMGFAGLNITYPCKQAVMPLLDELSPEAEAMGAVNTVVLRDGRLVGHNTDGSGWAWGFHRALPNADLGCVVLLGAGGAGSAISHAVLSLGAVQLRLVDTDLARARALAAALNARFGDRVVAYGDAAQVIEGATGLIHATPTGMDKLPGMPILARLLRASMWVSEIVYFPIRTELLEAARALGCPTVDGGAMAVGQAVGAFELFTGIKADAARVEQHFKRLLAGR